MEPYTVELLKEVKLQSKRWFIAFVAALVAFALITITTTIVRMRMDYRLDVIEQELNAHRAASSTYFEMMADYITDSKE